MSEDAKGRARIERELAGFPPTSVTVKVIEQMLGVLPHSPSLPWYAGVDDAAGSVFGGVPDDVLERARELLDDPRVDQAMFAARAIDTGDTGLTIVSGVRSALALFLGHGAGASMAQQQRADAALKALGLAYLLTRLVPRDPDVRVTVLESIPAGQEVLLYYAAIEIALPLAADVAGTEDGVVTKLVAEQGTAMADRLLGVIGREGVEDAREMLGHLTELLDRSVAHVQPHTEALADRLRSFMPPALGASGTIPEIVATGADALPCYRWLCARLAVESSLALAKLELMPELDLPIPPSEEPLAEVAPPPPIPDALGTSEGALPPNPFADPEPEPELPPNPFADPEPDALVPEPEEEEEDAPPPPPAAPTWPTESLPEAERLRGAYVDDEGHWRIFTREGVYAEHPPTAVPPDWDAHRAAGHLVALYERDGETTTLRHLHGRSETLAIRKEAYALEIGGSSLRRTDFDLSTRSLAGTWRCADDRLELTQGGGIVLGDRVGTYALGAGTIEITWADNDAVVLPFLSDLRPSSQRPAELWLGGRKFVLSK